MKILSDNIRLLLLLVLIGIGAISCSEDMEEVNDDAQVTFTTSLPKDALTRSAFGEGRSVNELVIGVFTLNENGEYSELMDKRHYADITDGRVENITLNLAKERTYYFVFWAYNSSSKAYDITDLTAIEMNKDVIATYTTFEEVENTDAFFATDILTVTADKIEEVKLSRPLAQINLGTSGMAVPSSFTVYDIATTFHPFEGIVSNEVDYFTWTFEKNTDRTLTADKKEYTYLAMCYLFAPLGKTEAMKKACKLILTETGEEKDFLTVELKANCRSNIVGSFTE